MDPSSGFFGSHVARHPRSAAATAAPTDAVLLGLLDELRRLLAEEAETSRQELYLRERRLTTAIESWGRSLERCALQDQHIRSIDPHPQTTGFAGYNGEPVYDDYGDDLLGADPPKLFDTSSSAMLDITFGSSPVYNDGEVLCDVYADDVTAVTNIIHKGSDADGWPCIDLSPKLADLSPLDSRDAICDITPIYDQYSDDNADEVSDALFDLTLEEEYGDHQPTPPAESRPSSSLFHHGIGAGVVCTVFASGSVDMKVLVPDPAFSTGKEEVTVLASTDGLVCLFPNNANLYIAVNPTFTLRPNYTTSGMPFKCSVKCSSLAIPIAATPGWVFRVAECFVFDPGTALDICCNGGLEPWPPPISVSIIDSDFALRPAPWPNFLLHMVLVGGFKNSVLLSSVDRVDTGDCLMFLCTEKHQLILGVLVGIGDCFLGDIMFSLSPKQEMMGSVMVQRWQQR